MELTDKQRRTFEELNVKLGDVYRLRKYSLLHRSYLFNAYAVCSQPVRGLKLVCDVIGDVADFSLQVGLDVRKPSP
ncbi:hypothetical protein ACVIGB_008255 [Bradyrhizobium sp. USDA 4341]